MRLVTVLEMNIFQKEGFEFELKCVDGWHKKKIPKLERLNINALAKLVADERVRIPEQ